MTASVRLDREGVGTEDSPDIDPEFATRHVALRDELIRRVRAEPGVLSVVLAADAPGAESAMKIEVERQTTSAHPGGGDAASAGHTVGVAEVDSSLFRAFGVPVLAGRAFGASDFAAQSNAVLVNRSFVERVLGGGVALGRRFREPARARDGVVAVPPGRWSEIVGVVSDFPTASGASVMQPKIYRPLLPDAARPLTVVLRAQGVTAETFGGRLRALAVAVDPMLRVDGIQDLDKAQSIERLADRFVFLAVTLVTVSVVLLSAAGIYALMSFTIARRRREIGIRSALGAGPRRVLAGVLRRAAGQIGLGIGIGSVVAAFLVQGMEGGWADVRGLVVLAAVAAFMAAVGLIAAVGPARRALEIQPTEALRTD
jgi:hypothetical protein